MRYQRPFPRLGLLLASLFLSIGCSSFQRPQMEAAGVQPKFSTTAYINSGSVLHLIVDVRAARLAGYQEFLPLHVAVLNRGDTPLVVHRESLVLETEDGTRLPLVSFDEFKREYTRYRADRRIGNEFMESLRGRYPPADARFPGFEYRSLSFFPARDSAVVPRDKISLREGELTHGFIYFRIPDPSVLPGEGRCNLLLRPGGSDEEYVVNLVTYGKSRKKRT